MPNSHLADPNPPCFLKLPYGPWGKCVPQKRQRSWLSRKILLAKSRVPPLIRSMTRLRL